MLLPKMIRVKQKFPTDVVEDIRSAIFTELDQLNMDSIVKSGDTVAVGAGSRGITNIDVAIKSVVDYLKEIGSKPFVFPAMGSHGGATPAGQKDILAHYGITEETMGVPVRATMEVVEVGRTTDDLPVFLDRYAYEADVAVPVNRVKSHTDFHGSIESGLMKMLAIGFGKQKGASMYHRAFFRYGFEHVILASGSLLIESGKIGFGVALVENAYQETAKVSAIQSKDFVRRERELLVEAKALSGKLPFDELDLLILDEVGKNISGTGMDTNIIGRYMQNFESDPEKPSITRIFARDLTEDSSGNATGIGLADFTTTRLVEKFDKKATYMNGLTGLGPQKSRIPFHYDTDLEVIEAALNTIGLTPPEEARVVRIQNTLKLDEVDISEILVEDAELRSDLEIISEAKVFPFDSSGNLDSF
ncbi:[Fe-S]-binding protein [Candidatus Poribacteria bacterium]|nr:[Fe-S]-binding protein [Candidatus Poribacteria bacterium]